MFEPKTGRNEVDSVFVAAKVVVFCTILGVLILQVESRQRLKRELKRFLRVVAETLGEPLMLGFALSRKFGFAVQRSV